MASNNWVISGKYTHNGKPLLANDPHLDNSIPSFWVIHNLHFDQVVNGKVESQYLMGSSMPGVPLVIVGRTKDISWGVTSANTDISDIFEEKINEEKYTY